MTADCLSEFFAANTGEAAELSGLRLSQDQLQVYRSTIQTAV